MLEGRDAILGDDEVDVALLEKLTLFALRDTRKDDDDAAEAASAELTCELAPIDNVALPLRLVARILERHIVVEHDYIRHPPARGALAKRQLDELAQLCD